MARIPRGIGRPHGGWDGAPWQVGPILEALMNMVGVVPDYGPQRTDPYKLRSDVGPIIQNPEREQPLRAKIEKLEGEYEPETRRYGSYPRIGPISALEVSRGVVPTRQVLGQFGIESELSPEALYAAIKSGDLTFTSSQEDAIADWLGANFKSSRSHSTGLETLDLAEFSRSPWGAAFQQILEMREIRLESEYGNNLENLHGTLNRLNEVMDSLKDDPKDPQLLRMKSLLNRQKARYQAKMRQMQSSLRSNDNLFLKMKNDEVSEWVAKPRGTSLLEHGNPLTGTKPVSYSLRKKIGAAQQYYATGDESYLVNAGLNVQKMPGNLSSFLESVAIRTRNTEAERTIREVISLSRPTNVAAISNRMLKAGRELTMDFYRLYGLGALPLGARNTMGKAILASTGRLAGSEVHILGLTNEGLWKRGIDGQWKMDPLAEITSTPANLAYRYIPKNMVAEQFLGDVDFSVDSEVRAHRPLHAFRLVADKDLLEDLATKSKKTGVTSLADDKLLAVLNEVNLRHSGIVTSHVARQVSEMRRTGQIGRGYFHGGDAFKLLVPEGPVTPARVVEEVVAGMLYGGKNVRPTMLKGGKYVKDTSRPNYIQAMNTLMRGNDKFSSTAREILRGIVPGLPQGGTVKEYRDALQGWALTAGLPHDIEDRSARMAIIRRTQAEMSMVERAARSATMSLDLPTARSEGGRITTLGDVLADGSPLNVVEPFSFGSPEGNFLRQEALRLHRMSPEKRQKALESLVNRGRNPDFISDVQGMVSNIEQRVTGRRDAVLQQAASLRRELTPEGVESFNKRVNRLRAKFPQLDSPTDQPRLVQMARVEIEMERQQLKAALGRASSEATYPELRRIAEQVHQDMLQAAELVDQAREIRNNPILNSKTKNRLLNEAKKRQQVLGGAVHWNSESPSTVMRMGKRASQFKQQMNLDEAYNMLRGSNMYSDVIDYVEQAYSGNPFVGRSAEEIYNRLVRSVGSRMEIHFPGYEQSYNDLFGERGSFKVRLQHVGIFDLPREGPNLDNAAEIRRMRASFELPAEMSEDERVRQMAAYLLPELREGWRNTPGKEHLAVGMSDEIRREATARALETIRKSPSGIYALHQEMKFEPLETNLFEKDFALESMVRDFVKQHANATSIFGRPVQSNEDGLPMIDEAIGVYTENLKNHLQEGYNRSQIMGRMRPVSNSQAMQEIEQTKRVHFLQESALSGPNMVTSQRHAENMGLLTQAISDYTPFNLPGPARSVREALGSSVLNPRYNPIVNGERLGGNIFDLSRQMLDEDLQSQGLSLKMVEDVSRAVGPRAFRLSDMSTHESEMVRNLMGLGDKAKYLNNPLARANSLRTYVDEDGNIVGAGERSLEQGASLETFFAQLTVNSRLEAQDIEEMAQTLGHDLSYMSGATRDELAEELYNLTPGLDLRVSTPRRIISDFLTQRTKAFMDPSMDAVYSEGQLAAMNQVRFKHGLIDQIPEEARVDDAAEAFSRPLTRVNWQEMNRAWQSSKLFRYGAIGAATLAGAGVLHAAIHKDHTLEDMQGPAYLPGGNPYQYDQFGVPNQAPPDTRAFLGDSATGGVEYSVRARGDFDPSQFKAMAAGSLGTNNISGSSYAVQGDSLGDDNSDQIAGMY